MRQASRPVLIDLDVYDNICTVKIGQPLIHMLAIKDTVISSYDHHQELVPNLENITHAILTGPQNEALKNTYDSEIEPILDLKAYLFERPDTIICPYCSLSPSSTLDHYVPKSDYPEFSVFSKNLIPVCWKCNHLKSNNFLHGTTRMYFNSYYDILPEEVILFCDILILRPRGTCKIRFYLSDCNLVGKNYEYTILVNHFQNLELASRYAASALDSIKKDRKTINRYQGIGGISRVREFFSEKAEVLSERCGINNWETVFYSKLVTLSNSEIQDLITILAIYYWFETNEM